MILLDANILLRMSNQNDPDYQRTLRVVFTLRQTDSVVLARQTLYEFWAVATRDAANNGLGMEPRRAARWITRYTRLFQVVDDPPVMFERWSMLVAQHGVRGFRAHDVRYVALAESLGIQKIVTYNTKHYQGFSVTVIDPARF